MNRALAVLASIAVLVTRASVLAQTPGPAGVELAEAPLRIESIGLTMQVPVGSTQSTTKFGGASAATSINDAEGKWSIRLQVSESADKALTIEQVSDKVVADVLGQRAQPGASPGSALVDGRVKVLARDAALHISGLRAARSYVLTPAPEGDRRDKPWIFGHTVIGLAPGRFLLVELVTTEPDYDRARVVYETVAATIRIADPIAMESSRLAAIATGQGVLDALTTEAYESVLGGTLAPGRSPIERWQRLYVPAPTGADSDAKEIAYRRIRTWQGHRGDLNPKRERARWTSLEQQAGYVVRIESRFLQDGIIYDSAAVFFMTPDRKEEAWSIQMAVKEPGSSRPAVFSETGARSERTLSVETNARGTGETIVPTVPDQGYVTQVEHYLLPQLLIRSGIAADFGFYVFQSPSGDVRLRRDSVSKTEQGWTIVTQMTEDMQPQTATYTPDGTLRSIELGDGRVWEPIESRRLLQLWKQKGLPLE